MRTWFQHLNWWWATGHLWGIYINREESIQAVIQKKSQILASDVVNGKSTSASIWIRLPSLLKTTSSGNGVSPRSTQIWTGFQCLVFSYSQTLFTFLSYSLWAPWELAAEGRKVMCTKQGAGRAENRTWCQIPIPGPNPLPHCLLPSNFLLKILLNSQSCFLTSSLEKVFSTRTESSAGEIHLVLML